MRDGLCRACPVRDTDGSFPRGPRATVYADDGSTRGSFNVVLLVSSGLRGYEGEQRTERSLNEVLDREDAIVALATAVGARGGVVTMTADVETALLAALSTMSDPARGGPVVDVMQTAGRSSAVERLLAPLVHAGVMTLLDGLRPLHGDELGRAGAEDGGLLTDARRHPLKGEWLDDVLGHALGVVVIDPDESLADELQDLQQRDVRVAVVGGRRLPPGLRGWAEERNLVREFGVGWVGPNPHGVLMEVLVDTWSAAGTGPPLA